MLGFTTLSLLISLLAFVGTSPFWLKLLLRYFYASGLEFSIGESYSPDIVYEPGDTIQYKDIEKLGIDISSTNEKWIKYAVVVYSGHPIDVSDSDSGLFSGMEIDDHTSFSAVDRLKENTSTAIVARNGSLGDFNGLAAGFPLKRPDNQFLSPSESTLRIALVPKIQLSEFGLPDFFGDAQLKPIVHDYTIINEETRDTKPTQGIGTES